MRNAQITKYLLGAVVASTVAIGSAACSTTDDSDAETLTHREPRHLTSASSKPSKKGPTEPRRASTALDPRIQAYVDAVNAEEPDALALAFTPSGVVIDVSREIAGRESIREWADNEVIGGSLEVLDIDRHPGGARLLVHWAPAGSAGWRAYYDFDVAADGITRADLQYAD